MLTDTQIKAAAQLTKKTGRACTLSDPGRRGEGRLLAMIRPCKSGRPLVEWYARQIEAGARRMVKLGTLESMTLAQAREAFRKLAPVIREGVNVKHHRQAERINRLQLGTLGELCEAYAANMEREKKRSASEARRCLLVAPDAAAKVIGYDIPARDVTPAAVADWLRPIHRRAPTMADQARRWLSACFTWGAKHENDYRLEASAARRWGIVANPAAAVPADTAARRAGTRHLSAQEFRRVWDWLATEAGRTDGRATAALRVIMATGQRVEEVLGLQAGQYQDGWLTWQKTKSGRPHAIPLPKQAATIMDALQPNRHGLYFPGCKYPDQPFPARSLDYLTKRCADALGIPRFCPRDMRRTWRTLAGDLAGLGAEECARIQNHTYGPRVAEKHYAHGEFRGLKATSMSAWEVCLNEMLEARL